eukprot:scaffold8740_cov270-Ochromonas_danica.AAC.1
MGTEDKNLPRRSGKTTRPGLLSLTLVFLMHEVFVSSGHGALRAEGLPRPRPQCEWRDLAGGAALPLHCPAR